VSQKEEERKKWKNQRESRGRICRREGGRGWDGRRMGCVGVRRALFCERRGTSVGMVCSEAVAVVEVVVVEAAEVVAVNGEEEDTVKPWADDGHKEKSWELEEEANSIAVWINHD
jgi:hypothetical protein